MNVNEYFLSLTQELQALQNRVRNLTRHWPTDGEWKESVIRTVLRRHLPANISVGRGFILKRDGHSTQTDLLIYDSSYPVIHQDGDLVFVTRDAVRGIIEVKTKLRMSGIAEVLNKLADCAFFVNEGAEDAEPDLFVGLFAYEFDGTISEEQGRRVLREIKESVQGDARRMINHVALGPSAFARHWPESPYSASNIADYQRWHFYRLENKAPGYFINNVVSAVASKSVNRNEALWFPREGKEINKLTDLAFGPERERNDVRTAWES